MNVGELFADLRLNMNTMDADMAAAKTKLAADFESAGQEASKKFSDSFGGIGEKMTGIGQTMSVGVTAPILAAGGLIVVGAADAEAATGKLQAQLGVTAEEAAGLGQVAEGVWVNGFGQNMEEVTTSIKDVRTNMGILADDELQRVTEGAMTIASAFDADVKESTAAAGVMMKSFGVSGQDAMDLITVGFQKGGDYSGELIDTLREYSPQFAAMGMSADQMLGILTSGAQAGAWNMDKVGDAVKEFNIRAQDGSKTTADGFKMIGLDAEQMGTAIAAGGEKGQQAFTATIAALAAMEDPVAQNAAGVALFGTQWEDVRSKVIVAMADGVKGVGDFKGATAEASKAMSENNPGLTWTTAMREVQTAVGPILIGVANTVTNTVVPAIKSLAEWFGSLSPVGQKVVLAVVGIAAAIGPLLMVVGPVASGFSAVVGAVTSVGGAVAGLVPKLASLVIGLGPVGIAIAAVIAIGVLLWQNWDTIKAKAQELWTKVTEVWTGITTFISAQWTAVTTATSTTWDSLVTYLTGIWDGVKLKVDTIFAAIALFISTEWTAIETATTTVWNGLTTFVNGIWDGFKAKVDTIFEAIRSFIDTKWTAIKTVTETIWGGLQTFVNTIWDGFKTKVDTVFEAIRSFIDTKWNAVKSVTETIWNGLETFIKGIWDGWRTKVDTVWDGFRTKIDTVWTDIKTKTEGVWNGLQTLLTNMWDGFKTKVDTVWDGIWTKISGVWDEVKRKTEEIWNGIKTWLDTKLGEIVGTINSFATDFYNAGKGIFNKVWDGMKDVWADLSEWVSEKIRWIKEKVKEWFSAKSSMGGGDTVVVKQGFASGGVIPRVGEYLVGELGPELVQLPAGARVIPNNRLSMSSLLPSSTINNNSSTSNVFNFSINARDVADINTIDQFVSRMRQSARAKGVLV